MSEESQYSFHHALTPSGNWPVEQGGSIVPEVAQRAIDKAVYFTVEDIGCQIFHYSTIHISSEIYFGLHLIVPFIPWYN